MQLLALSALSLLLSAVAAQQLPATCAPITKTQTSTYIKVYTTVITHSCYTATATTVSATCPDGANVRCIAPTCTVTSVVTTVPCKDVCCPKTPTVTQTLPTCTPVCTFPACATTTLTKFPC